MVKIDNLYIPKLGNVCQVCGERIRTKVVCPSCGHDRSTDYEEHMSLFKIMENVITTNRKREEWQENLLQKCINEKMRLLEQTQLSNKQLSEEKNSLQEKTVEFSQKKE